MMMRESIYLEWPRRFERWSWVQVAIFRLNQRFHIASTEVGFQGSSVKLC